MKFLECLVEILECLFSNSGIARKEFLCHWRQEAIAESNLECGSLDFKFCALGIRPQHSSRKACRPYVCLLLMFYREKSYPIENEYSRNISNSMKWREIEKKIQRKVIAIELYYTYIPKQQILVFFLIWTSFMRVSLLTWSRWQMKA